MAVHISRTSHLFHIVDQISEWSEFCHRQYIHYFKDLNAGLSARDKELLAEHNSVRKERSWGGGLEQTFYTSLNLEQAIDFGLKEGSLTPEQAYIEGRVFLHFAPRIEKLMKDEMNTLILFQEKLFQERTRLHTFTKQVSRFCNNVRPTVPVYLIANPDKRHFGGGFNGGRLTLEIPQARDAFPLFLHELMHAFLDTQKEKLIRFANAVEDLELETLSEGIAYALSPGIIHAGPEGSDPLLEEASRDIKEKKSFWQNSYARFRHFGLALRPALKDALKDERQSLESFLPLAHNTWNAMIEKIIKEIK